MNKEQIQSRIEQFTKQREQLNQQMASNAANIAAHNGAIEALYGLINDFFPEESAITETVKETKKNKKKTS